ncbi:hypothetical protein FOA52_016155 [Chlamydomonas sp. UWO 241]|nr:hypothetical protein FOA52_016155 [Chlamydomonas sp. UWO 241]
MQAPGVHAAASRWLRGCALRVEVSQSGDSISRGVTQVVQVCAEHKKQAKLMKHLGAVKGAVAAGARNPPRVLVFANRIKTVRLVYDAVCAEGYRAELLHGQRPQSERDGAVSAFRAGKVQVLVATDVAARGLDIRGLPYVVNYDFPPSLDTYIHRVGRTGRLSATGHAFSFFTRNLAKIAGPLADMLAGHGQALDPNLRTLAAAWSEAVARAGGEAALNDVLSRGQQKRG